MHADGEAACELVGVVGHVLETHTSDRRLTDVGLLTTQAMVLLNTVLLTLHHQQNKRSEIENGRKFRNFRSEVNRRSLDGSAPIFRIALMGAEENAETKSKSVETSLNLSERVEEKLNHGWSIQILEGGQLLLVPPGRQLAPDTD